MSGWEADQPVLLSRDTGLSWGRIFRETQGSLTKAHPPPKTGVSRGPLSPTAVSSPSWVGSDAVGGAKQGSVAAPGKGWVAGEAGLRAHQSDADKMETQVSRGLRGGPGSHLGFAGGCGFSQPWAGREGGTCQAWGGAGLVLTPELTFIVLLHCPPSASPTLS